MRIPGLAIASVLALCAARPAAAALTLNATGLSYGFTLSTFATGNTYSYNHLSAAPLSDGTLAVVDFANGAIVKYNDVDGQTTGTNLGSVSLTNVTNIARVGGHTYAGTYGGGYYEVSSSLSLTAISVPGITLQWGLWANNATGHLVAQTFSGVVDFDPVTGLSTVIANVSGDGVSVSPNGATAYVAVSGGIASYSIPSGTPGFFATTSGTADGTGVISGGSLNGYIVVVNNDGTVGLLDPTGATYETIATGGTRGDFASADSLNGTLFMAFYEQMYRLGIEGGTIGSELPEPATASVVALGLAALAALRRRARGSVRASA